MTGSDGASDAQRDELLELLLAEEGIELAPTGIPPRDRSVPPVLSYAQERMWFLDQLDGEDSSLGIHGGVALHGPLDVESLERSLTEIFRRHDVLRTVIPAVDGVPRPEVLPLHAMSVNRIDVEGDHDRLTELLDSESRHHIDLATEPPIVVTLIRVTDDHHVLSVLMHHIASDGSSFDVFSSELGALYAAFSDGRPSPLAPLPIQYEDYAAWQRHGAGDVFDKQLTYWRAQLVGPLPVFEIPTDHARPPRHTFDGATVTARLDADVMSALESLGDRSGATTFMVLLAAFEIVAARHAGQDDVVIGTPIAGRVRLELEPMIGAFLNTLVIRNDLGDDPTFRALLEQVRQTCVGAYANQDLPFELLLAELQPTRDLSRTPLFQIFFNMTHLDAVLSTTAPEGLRTEQLESPGAAANFDLTMYVNETSAGFDARLVYNRGLYDAEHMEQLVAQFQDLLAQIAEDPDRRIGDFDLTRGDGVDHLPDVTTALDDTWHGSVPDSVRRIAATAPDRACVRDGPAHLSYGDVAERMDLVSEWLRQRQVGSRDVVAIHADRTESLVWTIAGVLASGATYVVLDSRYPAPRLARLAGIATPSACIDLTTDPFPEALGAALDSLDVAHRVTIPRRADVADVEAILDVNRSDIAGAPTVPIDPDHPACLTFTSGSTGEPKAVIGRHGSLTHFLPWMSEEFGAVADDRFSMLSGLSHDPLQRDIFWPLSMGAAITVPDAELIPSPGYLADWIRDEGVSVVHLTPAMGQLLTDYARPSGGAAPSIDGLRLALFIGDVLTRRQVAELRQLAPNAAIVNLYGTTETQRASGYHVVDPDTAPREGTRPKEVLPLGRGMPGSQLIVRSTTGALAAVGEVGDVVMRSAHLALGYHEDDELTRARFAPDPHGPPAGQLYATGDRGRFRADGTVEFLGRDDDQVQVRGFRVELGEIAAALRLQPQVIDAVVVVRDDQPGRSSLVAYVVPSGERVDAAELSRTLRANVPSHMVPAEFVDIERVPLTPNGKLDRSALPEPPSSGNTVSAFSAPTDELEHRLVGIWEDVLGREGVGIDDDFFALGGYSLLATRVLALVEDATDLRLPIAELFEHPTIAGLAESIRRGGWRSAVPPITPAGDERSITSYAQERMWFLDQFEDERSSLAVGTTLALHGTLDLDALRASLDDIFNRHDVLRTTIVSDSGDPRPVVGPTGHMPLVLRDADGDADAALVESGAIARHVFDLAAEPPIIVGVVRVSDDHHVFTVLMHHAASDASSLAVFFHELQTLYEARIGSVAPELAPLGIQYGDYASWQRTTASELFDEQLDYWRGQLAGPLPVFEIPPDFRRPERHSLAGGRVVGHIPADLSERLALLAADNGATMFMTLLAGFEIALARHAGQTDVVIGTPVAGRVRPELEPLIGAFLNTVVLRTELGDQPSVSELLQRVRDTSLAAFQHQDVPFELLLTELRVPRDLSRSPLFQIFFNMTHHDITDTLSLPGFRTEIIDQADRGSKFDLTLYANHGADGTDLALAYNSTLFDGARVERILDQYLQVLEQMVEAPDRSIDEISLVTPADREVVPETAAPLDATWHGSVPAAVRRWADADGDRIAIVDGEQRWSYRRLDDQMRHVADWLLENGVGPGDVVAIHAQRAGSLVPAVCGALAAGAAYVLLDPSHPPQRLAAQLGLARPSAFIGLEAAGPVPSEIIEMLDTTDVALRASVPTTSDAGHWGAEFGSGRGGRSAVDAAIDLIGADDPACLTFTSGSTGTPKAVLGRHGSLTHFMPWMSEEFDVGEQDRFSMLSGLAHDPLQRDMFWPLWLGARIMVPDPECFGVAGSIARWMRDDGVTVAHLTPAMGQLLAEPASGSGGAPATVPSLRRALFIGAALTRDDVARLETLAPSVQVVNLYGTTETQRASGYHVVETEVAPEGAELPTVLPLGTGLPGSQLLITTADGSPAAVGEVGEIVMRSPHLALGYLDDEALTESKFATDADGTPRYATGDRGRYRMDGAVEFLGRTDDQVELRGFRIELGELTATLRAHARVQDAVARLWTPDDEAPRLVAYVRATGDEPLAVAELMQSLRASLPVHMIPSNLIEIDRVPLTPNGKLDHAALPAPDSDDAATDDRPSDALERTLVDIWKKVLGRKHVGIHDDFFALGGYSLLATRVFAMIEEQTGKQLPLTVLFQHTTISALAGAMRDEGWDPGWSSLVPIQPGGTRQPFFYVSAYLMSVLEVAPLGEALGPDQPLYGLQPLGLDGAVEPHACIEDMAAHYIEELKTVQPDGPYSLGGHCSGSWVAFEMTRQLEAAGEDVDALVLVDQGPPGFQRSPIKSPAYILGRVRFYFSGGRLRHALSWTLRNLTDRFLLRHTRSATSRIEGDVKEAHRLAHRAYQGGTVQRDLTLVLSADSMSLSDKAWYTLWSELTDASLTTHDVGGTHALMLVQPHVRDLGETIRSILDQRASARMT